MRDRPEPSLDDIERLAAELKLTLPPAATPPAWPDRLRLLAQWAVKPDSYNRAFLSYVEHELRGPRRDTFLAAREAMRAQDSDARIQITNLPDYDLYCYGNGRLRALSKLPKAIACTPDLAPDYRAFYPHGVELGEWNLGGHGRLFHIETRYDPTPNEWGVRAWCLQVLATRGWRSPLVCDLAIAHPEQWRNTCGPVGAHLIADRGEDQLAFWGINVPAGQLRPTVDAFLWDTVYYALDRQPRIVWLHAVHPGLTYQFPNGTRKENLHPLWQDWQRFSVASAAQQA